MGSTVVRCRSRPTWATPTACAPPSTTPSAADSVDSTCSSTTRPSTGPARSSCSATTTSAARWRPTSSVRCAPSRAAIPLLRAAGGGDIVNTSSESTLHPFPMLSMYVATKAALEAFGQVLAQEVRDDDIRVTTVVQGTAAGAGGGATGLGVGRGPRRGGLALWTERGLLNKVAGPPPGDRTSTTSATSTCSSSPAPAPNDSTPCTAAVSRQQGHRPWPPPCTTTSTTTPTTSRSTPTRTRSGGGCATRRRSTTTRSYDFFALSRFDDVERCLGRLEDLPLRQGLGPRDHQERTSRSRRASSSFEDPPAHDIHRGLLSPGVHAQADARHRAARCGRSAPARLDPLVGRRRLRLHRRPRRRRCRCARSACCSASPRRTRRRSGTGSTTACALEEGDEPDRDQRRTALRPATAFADYIDWRAEHPSDDLMTELLTAEFEDETGTVRRLTRDEVLNYVGLHRRRRQRDHDPADRLDGQGAGRAPRPARASWSADRVADPGRRSRSSCATRRRRRCRPATWPRTSSTTAQTVPGGQRAWSLLNGVGQPRRAPVPRRRPVRHPPRDRPPPDLRLRHPLLPRRHLARLEGRVALDEVLQALPDVGGRLGQRRPGPHLDRARLGQPARRHRLTPRRRVRSASSGVVGVDQPVADAGLGHQPRPDRVVAPASCGACRRTPAGTGSRAPPRAPTPLRGWPGG